METVRIVSNLELNEPLAIIGFKGWPNAGEVSTSALAFLSKAVKNNLLAEMDPGPFFDLSSHRPTARIEQGRLMELKMPEYRFYCTETEANQPTILFRGEEPHLAWDLFVKTVLDFLDRYQVKRIITVGGTYDEILHTSPPRISVVAEDRETMNRLMGKGVSLGEYEGPISIHTVLYAQARERGIEVISLWAHAPVYVQTGNFLLVKEVLELIGLLGGPEPDLSALDLAQEEMDAQIEVLLESSPKLSGYVEQLRTNHPGPASPDKDGGSPRGKVIPLNRTPRRKN